MHCRRATYRSLLYVCLLFATALFYLAAASNGIQRSCVHTDHTAQLIDTSSPDRSAADNYTFALVPISEQGSLSSRTTNSTASGARCSWLTGFRREISSPVFRSPDTRLSYLGRESAARSFTTWRTRLCGNSCGRATSVSRAGDGVVLALRRIVI
ncbi:hypothetical protein [Millionella massiliensis]|uniref:hypothetical protein n=1 Tax=Millionella massiliensis TaxID=1871023 RepID=UPI0024B6615F|nr:hypothetical protein [Millionella massiliensis]